MARQKAMARADFQADSAKAKALGDAPVHHNESTYEIWIINYIYIISTIYVYIYIFIRWCSIFSIVGLSSLPLQ